MLLRPNTIQHVGEEEKQDVKNTHKYYKIHYIYIYIYICIRLLLYIYSTRHHEKRHGNAQCRRKNIISNSRKLFSNLIFVISNGRGVGLATLPPSVSRTSENVEASTSRNPKGLHVPYRDNFTLP
jgi:hypothetical protein